MAKVVKTTGLTVAALVTLLCVYVLNVDWNAHREKLANALQERTGRQVTLGQVVRVEWGLRPTLVARDLHVANTAWGSRPYMLKVAQVSTQVALLPLISGELEIVDLTWEGVDLLLEISEKGVGNWQFKSTSADGDTRRDSARLPDQVRIRRLKLSNALISVRPAGAKDIHRAHIDRLQLVPVTPRVKWKLTGKFAVNGVPVTLDAATSAPGVSPFQLDGNVTAEGVKFNAEGTIASLAKLRGLSLTMELTVVSPNTIDAISRGRVTLPALDVRTNMEGSPRELRLGDIRLRYAGHDVKGELTLKRGREQASVRGALGTTHLDLRAIDETGRTVNGRKMQPGLLSWSEPLPRIPRLGTDLDIGLYADKVSLPGFDIDDFKTQLRTARGGIELSGLQARLFNAPVSGLLTVAPAAEAVALQIALTADGFDLQAAQQAFGVAETFAGRGNLKLDLDTSGATLAELAGKLDGTATLTLADAKARFGGLDAMVGGLAGLFSARGSEATWSTLNCGALKLDFTQGVGDTRLLLDTDKAVVAGSGDIDLWKTSLNLSLSPEPKSVTLNLAVPVDISGTFAEPRLTPQAAASIRRLGGLIGSIIFPPAALLAFADVGGDTDACLREAAMTASVGAASKTPGTLAETTGKAVEQSGEAISRGATATGKAVKGAVESIGNSLKSLFGN